MRSSTGRPARSPSPPPIVAREDELLGPAELGEAGADRPRVKRPVPVTTPRCSMPITAPGSHSVTRMRSTVVNGPTRVRQSNSVPTPDRCSVDELDRLGVGHPLGVRRDVLHRGPHRARPARRWWCRGGCASGRRPAAGAAACSGATEFAKIPLPSSNPATTLVRGTISTCQCISRVGTSGGAVWTITLYGAPGSARSTAASGVARCRARRPPSSASVASSIRARVERWATRSWYGDHDAGGHHAGAGPSTTTRSARGAPVRARRRRGRSRSAPSSRRRPRRRPVGRDDLRVRVLDGRAGARGRGSRRPGERAAGGEVERGPGRGAR